MNIEKKVVISESTILDAIGSVAGFDDDEKEIYAEIIHRRFHDIAPAY